MTGVKIFWTFIFSQNSTNLSEQLTDYWNYCSRQFEINSEHHKMEVKWKTNYKYIVLPLSQRYLSAKFNVHDRSTSLAVTELDTDSPNVECLKLTLPLLGHKLSKWVQKLTESL